MRIRRATEGDAGAIHAMLGELAAFEGGTLQATEADLRRDGFGGRPLFEALLAEEAGLPCGLLVFLPTYSSWRGRPGVMIHDLFVREEARGKGVGRALVAGLARLAIQRGCFRMDVNVLDWNRKARAFYASLGLTPREGWLGYRVEDGGLTELAERE